MPCLQLPSQHPLPPPHPGPGQSWPPEFLSTILQSFLLQQSHMSLCPLSYLRTLLANITRGHPFRLAEALLSLILSKGSLALEPKLGKNGQRRRGFYSNIKVNHPGIKPLCTILLLRLFSCCTCHRHNMVLGVKFLSALEKFSQLCQKNMYIKSFIFL